MKEGLSFEEKKEIPKVEKTNKLKGIDAFKLETEDEVSLSELVIPEPVMKNTSKPTVVFSRKKDSIF